MLETREGLGGRPGGFWMLWDGRNVWRLPRRPWKAVTGDSCLPHHGHVTPLFPNSRRAVTCNSSLPQWRDCFKRERETGHSGGRKVRRRGALPCDNSPTLFAAV